MYQPYQMYQKPHYHRLFEIQMMDSLTDEFCL